MTEEEELSIAVERVIAVCKSIKDVSPAWVATEAMTLIEFPRALHRLGYAGCHLEMRQIARSKLRRRFDPTAIADDDAEDQLDLLDLLPETLQERYPLPRKRGEEPRYRLLDELTDADVAYNVKRMDKAASSLQAHSRRLAAWHEARRAAS